MSRLAKWVGTIRADSTSALSKTKRKARQLQAELREKQQAESELQDDVRALERRIAELQLDLRSRDEEIERLTLRVELLQASLDYQLEWREKEVQRLRAEQAIHVRRGLDASSVPPSDGLFMDGS